MLRAGAETTNTFANGDAGYHKLSGTSARERYCAVLPKTAYSALVSLYMGKSGSAFFQSARKFS